ncbi:uncharacterized protein A1O9_12713 [Exophiala aquamarina CBS 119918]|uniref:Cytochrome P450 oxidoreductase n=1 Tax=Exophiala aquamarina CBS 119918 TaxID=1182545 RepID=A0A072P6H2_9EURO|nr:uncharacterized protein A1O9_12713 [Exophiala aquamarina CBS 119918]KEF51210.1 hypothetical protein A1O9_12713 [Exophiala aquamarina CBS 119918]
MFNLPPVQTWLKFKEWSDIFGPIFSFTLPGRYMVVVSTEKIANDLLRERGSLYSSREQLPMAAELMSKNLRTLLQPYDERWRRGRKLMHVLTMPAAATKYQHLQVFESERLIFDLLRDPSRYEELFERYAGAVIMRLGYAKTVESNDEPLVRRALEVVHTVERVASPGSYLVDSFPILMYLPKWLAPFKKEAEILHQRELSLFRSLMEEVRQAMKQPGCPPSFMKTFLERQDEFGLTDDEGAYVIGTLFEAGSGTTAAAMMSFCLAMCHYPDWQEKLQAEIDQVVGDQRLPAFDDIPELPLVRAVAKEVLRWRPVTAGGIPHQLIKDDTYLGFFFPAGTVVHANQW